MFHLRSWVVRRRKMFGMKNPRMLAIVIIGAIVLLANSVVPGQKKKKDKDETQSLPNAPAVLWRAPTDITSRDLYLGPGGEAMKPKLGKVTYIKEDTGGHTKKWRVRDASGQEWVVKFGNEAQPETAASRLVWAAGYYTDVTYFVP